MKDWAETAARVIHLQFDLKNIAPQDTSIPRLAAIIREHCPLKGIRLEKTMTIIEVPQGYWGDMSGTSRDIALAIFKASDEEFLNAHPTCAPYHRPCWLEREVKDDAKAPWGYEWYRLDAGILNFHSAQYDSSG